MPMMILSHSFHQKVMQHHLSLKMGSTSSYVCLIMCLVVASATVSEAVIPSAASLAHCRKSCGNVSIRYPFGIGSGCFREGFQLTCKDYTHLDSTTSMLFLGNNTNIQITDIDIPKNSVRAAPMVYNIIKRPGMTTYNISWETPVNGVIVDVSNNMYALGCGIELHLFNYTLNKLIGSCMSICSDKDIMYRANTDGSCYAGLGCCAIPLPYTMGAFALKVIFHDSHMPEANTALPNAKVFPSTDSYMFDMNELYSSQINTTNLKDLLLDIAIKDQPNCEKALMNKGSYACNDESSCSNLPSAQGYSCSCHGNPYILDGCTAPYNPNAKDSCTRSCGNLSIPFPFGIEEGCYGNENFRLNCTSGDRTILDRRYAQFHVTNVSADGGYLLINNKLEDESANMTMIVIDTEDEIYGFQNAVSGTVDSLLDFYEENEITIRWVIANAKCHDARLQNSTYACLGDHTQCLDVTHEKTHIGYRCKCSKGFQGNPYVQHGCTDIDECSLPNYCQGICQNYEGGFKCTSCPHGKSYDQTKRSCVHVMSDKKHNLILGIKIGAGGGLGSLILALVVFRLINKWKKGKQRRIRKEYFKKNQELLLQHLTSAEISAPNMPNIFSFRELEVASNNFNPTRILGSGGFGTVYKGILFDQRVVAIKKPKLVDKIGLDQFINEVAILSQIMHRNLVKLIGCCLETKVPLLVYEFISNGTLYDLLHKDITAKCFLTWNDRIRIAAGTAGALDYLHSTAAIKIFHRDVKSENILLDDSFNAKVSDFGLSRFLSLDETRVVTLVKGTHGYLDPEYHLTTELTPKSDVYSLGVVLVELLTRKKSIFNKDSITKQALSSYFIEQLQHGALMEIVDPQVVEEANQEDIEYIAVLAEACLRDNGTDRPTMKEVEIRLQLLWTKMLSEIQDLTVNHGESDSLSVCYSLEQELASSITLPR